jgi:hypothetical protein
VYLHNPWYRKVYLDGAGGGGGGGGNGGGGAINVSNPEVKKLLDAAVAEATSGLKKKTEELLGEKKKLEESFAELGDPKAIKELMGRINADEDMKLFTSGKREEYDNRITGRMKATYENQIKAKDDKIQDLEKTLKERSSRLADTLRDSAIQGAAAKLGVIPTAIPDVLSRAKSIFSVNDEANIVALDQSGGVVLGADGKKPLQPEEWLKGLKEQAPHLFPPSKGGGAGGGGRATGSNDDLQSLPPTERLRIARERQAGAK